MKTLDEFLDEIESAGMYLTKALYADNKSIDYPLIKAAKIIREMKEAIDELDIPMSMKITSTHRKHLTYENISKILNEGDGE